MERYPQTAILARVGGVWGGRNLFCRFPPFSLDITHWVLYSIDMMTKTEMSGMSINQLDQAAREARMGSGPEAWALADQYKAEWKRRLTAGAVARQAKVLGDTRCTDATDRHAERPNHRIYDALRDMDKRHDDLMTD